MAFKGTLAVVLLLQIFTQALAQAAPQPTANLGYSQYAGTFLSSGVSQFLGLRFAKPPTGDLRFAAPQPPESTDGVLQATEVRSMTCNRPCIMFLGLCQFLRMRWDRG